MKHLIKEQIEYLKDNPEGYWFKRKLYGWGWTPAKPAGWIVIGLYLVFLILGVRYHEATYGIENEPLRFVLFLVALTVLLVAFSWRKGEPPKWQWGKEQKEDGAA